MRSKSYRRDSGGLFEDYKWGYIDKTGKLVKPVEYDSAGKFFGGLAEVTVGDKRGYIDHAGEFVWGPTN